MAIVTGLTAARMLAIEAASVVDGYIDGSGHLILTKHDGTEIDAGNALVAIPDENIVHKLSVIGFNEETPPSSYPIGVSIMSMSEVDTTSEWPTFSGMSGSLQTVKYNENDITQHWQKIHGNITIPQAWIRAGNNVGGWGNWIEIATIDNIDALAIDIGFLQEDVSHIFDEELPNVYTRIDDLENIQVTRITGYAQSFTIPSYPEGESLQYLSALDATSGGWDFGGKNGTVRTYRNGNEAHQTWQRVHPNTTVPEMWIRGGNSSGWSPWKIVSQSATLPNPQIVRYTDVITVTATSYADLPSLGMITQVLPLDAIVQVDFGAWLYAPATANIRAGVSHNGGSPQDLFGGTWGNVLYVSEGNGQKHVSATARLSAGTHTFRVRAYRVNVNSNCNYPVLRVTVLRWAE